MEQILLDLASRESLFAVMFVCLFLYQIADSRKREQRLMDFMDKITEQFESLAKQYENLADDVDEIKQDMKNILLK